MSAVINRAKRDYRKALTFELMLFLAITVILSIYQSQLDYSFLLGWCASVMPFGIFVYWVFFRNNDKYPNKMTAFYRGEAIKWVATILIIVATFKWVVDLKFVEFFVGYFLGLVLNIVLPPLLKRF